MIEGGVVGAEPLHYYWTAYEECAAGQEYGKKNKRDRKDG